MIFMNFCLVQMSLYNNIAVIDYFGGFKVRKNVVIIGASPKPSRYSYKAQEMLVENGHQPFPVSQRGHDILNVAGYSSIADIKEDIHTVTIYINAKLHELQFVSILKKNPKRIIFNPGTESDLLMQQYKEQGIDAFEACTLVLLRTNQF